MFALVCLAGTDVLFGGVDGVAGTTADSRSPTPPPMSSPEAAHTVFYAVATGALPSDLDWFWMPSSLRRVSLFHSHPIILFTFSLPADGRVPHSERIQIHEQYLQDPLR